MFPNKRWGGRQHLASNNSHPPSYPPIWATLLCTHCSRSVIRDADDAWINNEGEESLEYRPTLCVPSVIDLRGKFPPDDKY